MEFEIELTPELEAMVHAKIASGQYADASAVISEALDLLEAHEQRLRAAIAINGADVARGDVTD